MLAVVWRCRGTLAAVTVPVGVTETFLLRFISSLSCDVLGSCVHSVSSCFTESPVTYPHLQEAKEWAPQDVADQEVEQKRFSPAGASVMPASFFASCCLLCLRGSQALLATERFIFLSLFFMFLVLLHHIFSSNQSITLENENITYVFLSTCF